MYTSLMWPNPFLQCHQDIFHRFYTSFTSTTVNNSASKLPPKIKIQILILDN